ncbi:cellulose-binding domain-containing protein [Actinoplanes sp. KI2]|uniref:cellulose-binding domain-containing protein n=1 Tax=Actinoplanes sp. KI2 TaxID=2983315 RepID=UPI0021D5C8E5|nr:cellulose-binding domain-containing protein [Actinoplanes sp. KI2]MCU7728931.1 cellulose-binding domain-containing protein [Actinoplanes sp. KI2]
MRKLIAVALAALTGLAGALAAPAAVQAAPCASTIQIDSLTFDPPQVAPGQGSTATVVVHNCTAQPQTFSVMTIARFLGATSGIPAGCPVIDPLPPRQVTLAGDGSWSGSTGYSVFSGCTATTLEVSVSVTDPAGTSLARATADLPIAAAAPPCAVSYRVTSQWDRGFVAQATITNTTGQAINGWTLTFAYSAGQRVTSAWNAAVTQTSTGAVSAGALDYNATIAPGASVAFGFLGTWSGSNPAPSAFTLNGAACRT